MRAGPKGLKRKADVIGNAVLIGRIATGDEQENAVEAKRKAGLKGGKARAKALTPQRRSEIARVAAEARWKKTED